VDENGIPQGKKPGLVCKERKINGTAAGFVRSDGFSRLCDTPGGASTLSRGNGRRGIFREVKIPEGKCHALSCR